MLSGVILTLLFVSLISPSLNQVVKVSGQQAGPTIYEGDVPVRGVYLFADDDVVKWDDNGDGIKEQHICEAPLIVDLTSAGFKSGDLILISSRGEVRYGAPWDWNAVKSKPNLWGIFSSSNILLYDRSQEGKLGPLHRVPDAIDAGKPNETGNTFKGSPTDIPEDFEITYPGISIKIPSDATYLMLAFAEIYYPDDDGWLKVTIEKDTDEDGLWDSWEFTGIDSDRDGTTDLKLEDADWERKDIYVEVDYMQGHNPSIVAMNDVQDAFTMAPVDNPDGSTGITLHIEVDYNDPIPHQDVIYDWGDFVTIKDGHFGTTIQRTNPNKAKILEAKKMAYHYCLFAHQYALYNGTTARFEVTTSGGLGECPGNDFFITLGAWTGGVGSTSEQAASFMHELGHNLDLDHGGRGDETNYKPNYLSIMNYLFQMPDTNPSRPLDYSRYQLPTLDENKLNETKGIIGGPGYYYPGWISTVYSKPPNNKPTLSLAASPVDWNGNGKIDNVTVQANPNNYPQWDYSSPSTESLKGSIDWVNLLYNFRDTSGYSGGAVPGFDDVEITWETVQAMREEAEKRHEVAATNLTASAGTIGQTGFTVNVTLVNLSINPETSNITIYVNATKIASKTITLSDNNFTTISIPCTTAELKIGNYKLTAYVNPLANETNTLDNTVIGGIIKVVDLTPPVTTATYDGLWHNADYTVTLNATDNESSVAETYYNLNNEDSIKTVSANGQPRFTADSLNNTLSFWSVDVAGNIEKSKFLSGIKLDKTPPTVTISSPASGGKVEASAVTVTWSGSDATSGVKGYDVRVDGGSWVSVDAGTSREFTGLSDSSHTVDVRATDVAGNSKLTSVGFTVDTRPWLLPVVAVGSLVIVAGIIIFLRRNRGK